MMNLFLILAIILTNAVALGLVYQILKRIPKKELLIFMAASVAIIYIFVSITYFISGFGIDEKIHESSKNMIIYLFVPVDIILFIPYLALQYRKAKEKKIKYIEFANKMAIEIVIFIILLVGEGFYFHSIQQNIDTIGKNQEGNTIVNEQTVNEKIEDAITNEVFESTNNITTNIVSTNESINTNVSTNEMNTNNISTNTLI